MNAKIAGNPQTARTTERDSVKIEVLVGRLSLQGVGTPQVSEIVGQLMEEEGVSIENNTP
ncbi:hypothetical protein [Paroceanicella profunda]|uniref:hypothetical protein n=1 Tax=Paroceanicella profunda TaxID=2579971 RepID=UPI001478DD1D|nr:hypothetical protein [Paroceanicella profunda]